MKKLSVLILTVVFAFLLLTACSDPLQTEFENFINVQMTEVNANYEAITAECGKWLDIETDEEWAASINALVPKCNETLEMLSKIEPEAEEIKALKAKFTSVIELYKEGFEKILAGIEAVDEAVMLEGDAKIAEGLTALDEYNLGLETLAAQFGFQIEY